LTAGADEYKALFRKHAALEQRLIEMAGRQGRMDHSTTTLSSVTGLNEEALVTLLRNSYELQQKDQQENEEEEEEEEKKTTTTTLTTVTTSAPPAVVNGEIAECPMCYWEFPAHLTLENKKEHIDQHFA